MIKAKFKICDNVKVTKIDYCTKAEVSFYGTIIHIDENSILGIPAYDIKIDDQTRIMAFDSNLMKI